MIYSDSFYVISQTKPLIAPVPSIHYINDMYKSWTTRCYTLDIYECLYWLSLFIQTNRSFLRNPQILWKQHVFGDSWSYLGGFSRWPTPECLSLSWWNCFGTFLFKCKKVTTPECWLNSQAWHSGITTSHLSVILILPDVLRIVYTDLS